MAIADFASGFFDAFVSLQQRQEQNTRADRELVMQQQRQDQAFKQAEMQRDLLKMQFDHEAKMQPLQLEEQKLEIERAKKLTGDENFARVMGMGNLLRDTERKARMAEASGDETLMKDVPMLRFQSNYLRDQLKGAMGQLQQGPVPGGQAQPGQDVPGGGADTQSRFPGPTQPPTPSGAVPGEQTPPGAAMAPPQPPMQEPMEGTIEFYQSLTQRKPGSEFTTPSGTAFKVFQTEEEVKAEQERRQRLQGEFEGYRPKNTPIAIAGAEKKVAALQEEQAIQQAKEVQRKRDVDMVKTIANSQSVDFELRSMGSSTRFQASPETGVSFSNVDVRNIGKDRAAFDRMAQQGKMTTTTLKAYDQALTESVTTAIRKGQTDPKAEQWQKELANSLIEASPGEGRINRMDTTAATSLYLTQLNGMLRTIEAGGVVPSFRIRESVPHETTVDLQNALPEGARYQEPLSAIGRAFPTQVRPVKNAVDIPEAARLVTKYSAQVSRSLSEIPAGPAREAARAEAKRLFDGIAQTTWVGQFKTDVPRDDSDFLSATGGRSIEELHAIDTGNQSYQAVQAILGPTKKPAAMEAPFRAPPRPVGAPGGLMKGGKVETQSKTTQTSPGGGGGALSMRSALILAGVIGAKENVDKANVAFGTIGPNTKNKDVVAGVAVTTVRDQYGKMDKKEKETAQASWKGRRKQWKDTYKIKDTIIKDMNAAVGLDRNDGFGK